VRCAPFASLLPAFYNQPASIDEMVDHTVARVLDRFCCSLPRFAFPGSLSRVRFFRVRFLRFGPRGRSRAVQASVFDSRSPGCSIQAALVQLAPLDPFTPF
jgi:hypothetical protein